MSRSLGYRYKYTGLLSVSKVKGVANVQEEFQDNGAQVALEVLEPVDLIVPFFAYFLRHEIVNACCKHIFIVGPVES
jgi:hypothetical protein